MSWLDWVKSKVKGEPPAPPAPPAEESASAPEMVDVAPGDPGAEIDRAWELHAQGDPVAALVSFRKAIALAPTARAYYGRGVVNCTLHRYPEAIADLERALALRPRFAQAITERGLAFAESGDEERAIADYDAAIALEPAYGIAHENKGLSLLRMERWAEAIPCFDVALRLTPHKASIRYHRGLAHELLGDLPRALRDLRDSVRHAPQGEHVQYAEQRLARLRPRAQGLPAPADPAPESLWPVLTGVTLADTVGDFVQRVHREGAHFAQIDLPGGQSTFAQFYGRYGLRRRLTVIADAIGPRILALRLDQLGDLFADPPSSGARDRAQPTRQGETTYLVEGTQLHVLKHGDRLLGVFSEAIEHDEIDLPTALFGERPIFERSEEGDQARSCASCRRAIAYFDPIVEGDQLTDYACPSCGASPIHGWIEERMRPGRWSRSGFLGKDEALGEVIDRDARTLERLGVDHAAIGDALDRLLSGAFTAIAERIATADAAFEARMRASGMRGVPGLAMLPLGATLDELEAMLRRRQRLPADRGSTIGDHQVFLQIYLGYQYCPFTRLRPPWSDEQPRRVLVRRRTSGVAYVSEPTDRVLPCHADASYRHANLEFLIVRTDDRRSLRGAGLLAHLIREHRFFEGERSPFRLDPEVAARVLGLAR